jgi:zinc protease
MKFSSLHCAIPALIATLTVLISLPAYAQVTEMTMDNGLRVVVAESHAVPIVAVDVWVRAGTRREKPDEPGVAHYLEHMIFNGTPLHPTEESVDGSIEDLGGSIDAATSYDWAHFFTEVPTSGYSAATALLADVLEHSTLDADAVESERQIILDEIDRASDDPGENLQDTARSLIYDSQSAYARPITGTSDDVKAVTRDEIVTFYKTYYVPNNVTVVISGDVTTAEAQTAVKQAFGDWKESDTLPDDSTSNVSAYVPTSGTAPAAVKRLIQNDANESYLVMAFHAPPVCDTPDAWDMDVLLTLFGQGGNNRLNTELKVKQNLVTSIQADYLTQHDPGILTVTASMPTANVDAVQVGILDQIQQLRTTQIGSAELTAAKLALKASYLFDVDTDSGHADSLGFYDMIDSYQYDADYQSHIDSVTSADIQRIAIKYLDPSSYTLVLQVPPSDPITASSNSLSSLVLASDGRDTR